MSLRYRRKRILIIFVVSIVFLGLFRDYLPTRTTVKEDNDQYEQAKQRVKPFVDGANSSTSTSSTSPRTEIVEINGKSWKKIDWHDYAAIARENARTGTGEGGIGVEPSAQDRKNPDFDRLYRENGFYGFMSDIISLDRSVKDIRHSDCKTKLYLEKLPSISIIIPVHDEHLSTLLRSIHSILNRTPPELLKEILLVDDASTKGSLKGPLDAALANLAKTRVIHLPKREGLIRARLAGARKAKGEILVFFDSHIEVNINWLPPLIEPIALDYKTSVCPFIDIIKLETFAYTAQDEGARGAFDWGMFYKRLPLLPENTRNPTEPFDNPVMAGGLFAISAKWFWELGGYDEGLDVWGGEQYEMSFKIWQCGGRLVDAPCSRVGHIYRQFNPHGGFDFGDYLSRNHKRVAVVWMDEYAKFVYKRNLRVSNVEPGDISKQVALRKKLGCKPFKWFMEKVAFDLPQYYPPIPIPPFATGEIRSMAAPLCVDTKHAIQLNSFGVDQCLKDNHKIGGEQEFELGWRHDIRPKNRELCFDVPKSGQHTPIVLFNCHGMRGNQHFVYNIHTFQIRHVSTGTCLECDIESKALFMEQCNKRKQTQEWKFASYNETFILKEMQQFFG